MYQGNKEFKNGTKVKVLFNGDDEWYNGVIDGKEYKIETRILNHPFLKYVSEIEIKDIKEV